MADMRRLLTSLRNRVDLARGDLSRFCRRTHLLEEMGGHPERLRDLPDPGEELAYGDIAEQLLDDGLAEVCERTGWTR